MMIRHKLNRGFSLVTAIFLLVVLSMLGAMMVTFFTVQQQSSALDVLGSRAYQASRAGIEWGAFQVLQSGVAGTAFASACQTGGALPQPPQPLGNTLAPFTVSVGCSATSHVESGNTLWVYNINSVARTTGMSAGSPNYVERQIQVAIGK
jgi:MSHA biogenesis protein MshP